MVNVDRWDLLAGVTYTMNYYEGRGWALGHLWSLAVEEQFYLLWPFTLRTLGIFRSTYLLVALIAAAPLFRLMSPFVMPAFNFLIWSDALATGCLLAILRDRLTVMPAYSRLLESRFFFLIPAAAVAANYLPSTKVLWLVGDTVMNVAVAISADYAMRNPDRMVGRFLNLPSVSFVGVLSYSLYLWQQLFLNNRSTQGFCAFPLNIVLAFVLATLSYVCIEAPFLRLRSVIEHRGRKRKEVSATAVTSF